MNHKKQMAAERGVFRRARIKIVSCFITSFATLNTAFSASMPASLDRLCQFCRSANRLTEAAATFWIRSSQRSLIYRLPEAEARQCGAGVRTDEYFAPPCHRCCQNGFLPFVKIDFPIGLPPHVAE